MYEAPILSWELRHSLLEQLLSVQGCTPEWADEVEATAYAVYGSCGLGHDYLRLMTDLYATLVQSPRFFQADPKLVALLDAEVLRQGLIIDTHIRHRRDARREQKEMLENNVRELAKRVEAKTAGSVKIRCHNPDCRSTNITVYEQQTRSADEPMTVFYVCEDCGATRKT
jgi:DNA-directed RNA polymerase subunit M/transcription elongation factor TFIIS